MEIGGVIRGTDRGGMRCEERLELPRVLGRSRQCVYFLLVKLIEQ
jgi:hypothetical protein